MTQILFLVKFQTILLMEYASEDFLSSYWPLQLIVIYYYLTLGNNNM